MLLLPAAQEAAAAHDGSEAASEGDGSDGGSEAGSDGDDVDDSMPREAALAISEQQLEALATGELRLPHTDAFPLPTPVRG